jgi:hypothetical protein
VSNYTVLYDACVLYPAPLRDLLMHVAVTELYRAKWTDGAQGFRHVSLARCNSGSGKPFLDKSVIAGNTMATGKGSPNDVQTIT